MHMKVDYTFVHRLYTDVQMIWSVNKLLHCLSTPGVPFGQSTSILTEMRTALLASRALRLNLTMNLPAD